MKNKNPSMSELELCKKMLHEVNSKQEFDYFQAEINRLSVPIELKGGSE